MKNRGFLILIVISGLSSESYFDIEDFKRDTRKLIESLENSLPAIEQHANFNSNSKATSLAVQVGGAVTYAAAVAGVAIAAPYGKLIRLSFVDSLQ